MTAATAATNIIAVSTFKMAKVEHCGHIDCLQALLCCIDVAKEVDAQESDSQLLYSTLSCALAAHAFRARVRSRYISPYGRGKC
jgi:hypothetical protein